MCKGGGTGVLFSLTETRVNGKVEKAILVSQCMWSRIYDASAGTGPWSAFVGIQCEVRYGTREEACTAEMPGRRTQCRY